MSDNSTDTAAPSTGAAESRPSRAPAAATAIRRPNVIRGVIAGTLLIAAAFFPWNGYFGFGVPDSRGIVFVLLALATALAVAAVVVTLARPNIDAKLLSQIRLGLSAPYFLLVIGFVVFTLVQTVRYGGTGTVTPGIGPGAWL